MAESRFLRMPEVIRLIGLKKSAIYQKVGVGEFPSPVSLGSRAVAWKSDEIQNWMDTRPKSFQIEKVSSMNNNSNKKGGKHSG